MVVKWLLCALHWVQRNHDDVSAKRYCMCGHVSVHAHMIDQEIGTESADALRFEGDQLSCQKVLSRKQCIIKLRSWQVRVLCCHRVFLTCTPSPLRHSGVVESIDAASRFRRFRRDMLCPDRTYSSIEDCS